MANLPILTALNVPTVGPQPSINCLQWSHDGQLVVITKAAIYLLTPDLGIYFDNSSVLKAPVVKRDSREKEKDEPSTLGWFRTLIEFEKVVHHQWPLDTQEWGAVSLGSLDVSWRSATISPSNLTADAGYLIVAMSSNMEASLWRATKNYLKGAWVKIQDITSTLKEVELPDKLADNSEETKKYISTLHAQVNCVAWSSAADFGLSPRPLLDGSILAMGNRAGSVILMRFDGTDSVKHVRTLRIANDWVTHLAWSQWACTISGGCEALLACGISDGSIVLVKVHQTVEQLRSLTSFGNKFRIHIGFEISNSRPADADGRGITALAWINTYGSEPLVVHAKPGTLHLYRVPRNPDTAVQTWTLRLQTQHISAGSSSLTPVSCINHIKHQDALIVTLFDGSYHVVQNLSSEPCLTGNSMDVDGAEPSELTSAQLSHTARAVFEKAEGGSMRKTDVNRTSGGTFFDGSSTVIWLHEASRPTDFSYKHDAKHNSMLVVAQLWGTVDNDQTMKDLQEIFTDTRAASDDAPIHVLRRVFLQLRQPKIFETLVIDLLGILLPHVSEGVASVIIPPWTGDIDGDTRMEFRTSLTKHLYGWELTRSLRLRLAVADFCWKICQNEEVREQLGRVAQTLLVAISHHVLRTLIRHIAAIVDVLTASDSSFVLRVIIQSLLPGSPPDLLVEANKLSSRLNISIPASSGAVGPFSERCPACNEEIPLENIVEAVCPKGHVWSRCSISSFLLSTPMVRTCVGCTRKALLPPSQISSNSGMSLSWIPEADRSWIVEELLEAARCCLFCGNRFVRIL